MPKKYRAKPERTIVLPQGLYAGPGATNMRLQPGQVVTLEDAALVSHSRWINGRVTMGDLEEVDLDTDEAVTDELVAVPSPNAKGPAPRMGIELGKPAGKDKP